MDVDSFGVECIRSMSALSIGKSAGPRLPNVVLLRTIVQGIRPMRHRTTLLVAAILVTQAAVAQAPSIVWERCLGGSYDENGTSMDLDQYGGSVVGGWTYSLNGDVLGNPLAQMGTWLVEVDDSGVITDQVFSPPPVWDGLALPVSVAKTADGGYLMVSATFTIQDIPGLGNLDVWLVKRTAQMDVEWQRVIGSGPDDVPAVGIQAVDDEGFVIAAYRGGSFPGKEDNGPAGYWLERLDANGASLWQTVLPEGGHYEPPRDIIRTSDGGYVICGSSAGQLYMAKVDDLGGVVWEQSFGGSDLDYANAIAQAPDGGFYLAGVTGSNDGSVTGWQGGRDAWVIRTDANGLLQWQKTLGGSYNEEANAIAVTSDGGCVVGGWTNSIDGDVANFHGGQSDGWVVKLSPSGSLEWEKNYGGSGEDVFSGIGIAPDGNYILAGTTYSNDLDVQGHHGGGDMWILKLDVQGVGMEEQMHPTFTATTEPGTGQIRLTFHHSGIEGYVTLTDALGRTMVSQRSSGTSMVLNVPDPVSGVYVITLRTSRHTHSQRVVME